MTLLEYYLASFSLRFCTNNKQTFAKKKRLLIREEKLFSMQHIIDRNSALLKKT